MSRSVRRAIPSVDKILNALGDAGLPQPVVTGLVRRELSALRKRKTIPGFDELLALLRMRLRELRSARIQPVINGTGILIHTNFGRAPLGADVIKKLCEIGSNYNNLEYGIGDGTRAGRAAYLEQSLALLCGSEAATVVNNNAAALILILKHLCMGAGAIAASRSRSTTRSNQVSRRASLRSPGAPNEVIISRGELVQIGGGFRIPEILETSGARLREVGTTNKTSLDDYARAITAETALILKVHHSNFYMDGFVESPRTEAIAELAHRKGVAFVEDLGSGAIIETASIAGLEHEMTPMELIRRGADLVCFSGDKLFGGPQAGIIVGNAKRIAALKREPFMRALRCDKLILAALETTVDMYLRQGHGQFPSLPVIDMLRLSSDELQVRANKIASALQGSAVTVRVGFGRGQVGGGTLPRSVLPSVTIDLSHPALKAQELAARLREHAVPIIGYVSHGTLKLDLRTIFPDQDAEIIKAVAALPAHME